MKVSICRLSFCHLSNRVAAWLLAAFVLASISACNPLVRDATLDSEVQSLIQALAQHKTEAVTERLDPTLRGPESEARILDIERLIPPGEPTRHTTVTTSTFESQGRTTVRTADECVYGDRVALYDMLLSRSPGPGNWVLRGFHVQVATLEQLKENNFALAGKSTAQYAFLFFLVTTPLLSVAALIKVLRTPKLRRKWLWCLIAVLGIGIARMNWATGAVSLMPISIQFLGASVFRGSSSFAPWMLSVSVPVGAILILTGMWAKPRRTQQATSIAGESSARDD